MTAYLGEGEGVELVLGSDLKTRGLAVLDVVGGLGADLDGGVDLLVVRSGDDGEVLGADEGGGESRGLVAETEGVAGDGGLLDVVASLTTNEETLVAGGHVDDGVKVAVGEAIVDESAGVDVGVLEGKVELLGGAVGLAGVPEVLEVDLDAGGGDVGELDLGVEEGGGGPGLGDGDVCARSTCQDIFCVLCRREGSVQYREIDRNSQGCWQRCGHRDDADKAFFANPGRMGMMRVGGGLRTLGLKSVLALDLFPRC